MKILVIEDNTDLQDSYKRAVRHYDFPNGIVAEVEYATTYNEAMSLITEYNYDAITVDLKLSSDNTDYEGESILSMLRDDYRSITIVITGNPEIIEAESDNQNALFQIKIKGEEDSGFETVLSYILRLYSTGITKILGNKGVVEKYLHDIFWKNMVKTIDGWANDSSRSMEEKEKSLLRYSLLHMQEYIDEDLLNYHPSEFYIIDPIKRNISTGDIVLLDEQLYVVLTPMCDIVLQNDGTRNTDRFLFCKISSAAEIVENYDTLTIDTGENNRVKKKLLGFINNGKMNFHFLPPSYAFEGGMINFRDKLTLSVEEFDEKMAEASNIRKATISAPFLKDIISRYSNYYARQGAPGINGEEIYKILMERG